MKRIGNLYEQIYSWDNLVLADQKARIGKSKYKEIKNFDLNKETNLTLLQDLLINNNYKTSEYTVFKVIQEKERIISKLPYFPDRILHHAVMNILQVYFVKCFVSNTFNCIKGRGIHKAFYKLKRDLKDTNNTQYCLKLDIEKFYPSINHDILKFLLRKKFKDNKLLILLDEIIDSTGGIPIGSYLSQYFGNFYLTYFDYWVKEKLKIKYYYRYCDDLVILHSDKTYLYKVKKEIRNYLSSNLKLTIKSNYQIFPINKRGIDFIGYKFYHTHVLLRKRIKKNYIKMIKYNNNDKSKASYHGWLVHCNSKNLENKYNNYGKNSN